MDFLPISVSPISVKPKPSTRNCQTASPSIKESRIFGTSGWCLGTP